MPQRLDYVLDLGHGYHTRLLSVLGTAPPEAVTIDPPYPGLPTMFVHMKHGLGVLPCYENADGARAWIQEHAPHFLDLGGGFMIDSTEIVIVLPVEAMAQADPQIASPTCYVQALGGLMLPAFRPAQEIRRAIFRSTQPFFGEEES